MHPSRVAPTLVLALLLGSCNAPVSEPVPSSPPVVVPVVAGPSELPPREPGEWIESLHYRLRLLDVTPCDDAASGPGVAGRPFRLGVALEVQATDETRGNYVLASPKAAELEKNGQVFPAIMRPTPTAACPTPLVTRTLAAGESSTGIVVFEAPSADYLESAVLRFKPPRWGHEARVGVLLPSCFGAGCG